MTEIKTNVSNTVDAFRKSHFFLSVAQNQQYDDDTQFNESNVTLYLAELEEYISLFITYLAYKQEHQDAAIASLSLNELKQKDWESEMNPQKKYGGVVEANKEVVWHDEDLELETEDDVTIQDSRKLY
jgi:hypothetical protein